MRCERHEQNISALLDGELEAAAIAPLMDHLLTCSACRRFYHDARELDLVAAAWDEAHGRERLPVAPGMVPGATGMVPTAPRAAPGALAAPSRPSRPGLPFLWSILTRPAAGRAAAAALLLALGFAGGRITGEPAAERLPEAEQVLEVRLGEAPGEMSQERFLALTLELLRAQPRFRQEMLAVMDEVCGPPEHREGWLLAAGDPMGERPTAEETPPRERGEIMDPRFVAN